ncbi:MAG TPA: arylsulfatase, partial [Candidatus Hydrogenedentes bacterium]|nr:arylsulfatase [Candidatus Hydrogenedentota bacterium]
RGDCLGCDGHPAVRTPHLDRLAREGARFAHAYSSTPTCTPARAALLTGMSPWNHGMIGYGKVAEKYPVEMPQALRAAGYYTTGIGKMHWTPQRALHGFHQTILDESSRVQSVDFRSDYRAWFASVAPNLDAEATGIGWNDYRSAAYALPEELHPTRWTADVATCFIETYDRDDPFFLKVSFARPHSPYDPPQRWMDAYADAPIPERHIGDWCDRYRARSDDSFNIWHGDLGPEQARRSRQGYYGSVSFLDEQIGRILAALERRGWLDDTLILFTADHGDMTGDHHLWRKSYAYEPSARIPMILRWPGGIGAPRGQVREEPVEIRDVLATFLDTAGTAPPAPIDGASLLGLVRGEATAWREYIDLEHDICYDKSNHWCALTDGETKYIYDAFGDREQLFDLRNDPGEERDLAGNSRARTLLEEWRARLVAHLEPRGEEWVRNGKLAPRPASMLYSPNYPKQENA